MIEKITEDNIDQISVGDIIYKYPVEGVPVDKIDLEDSDNIVIRFLSEITLFKDQFAISSMVDKLLMRWSGFYIPTILGPIYKRREDIIAESCWWYQKNYYYQVDYDIYYQKNVIGKGSFLITKTNKDVNYDEHIIKHLNAMLFDDYNTRELSAHIVRKTLLKGEYGVKFNNTSTIDQNKLGL